MVQVSEEELIIEIGPVIANNTESPAKEEFLPIPPSLSYLGGECKGGG